MTHDPKYFSFSSSVQAAPVLVYHYNDTDHVLYQYVATRTPTTVTNFQAPNSANLKAWLDFWTSRGIDPLHMSSTEFIYSARTPYNSGPDSLIGPWWCAVSSFPGLTVPHFGDTDAYVFFTWQMYCSMARTYLLCITIAEAADRIRANQLHDAALHLFYVPVAAQSVNLSDPGNMVTPFL